MKTRKLNWSSLFTLILLALTACGGPVATPPTVGPTETRAAETPSPAETATATPAPTETPTPPPLDLADAEIAYLDVEHHLWVMNADGTAHRQLTQSGVVRSPTWSPDGQTLTYVYAESENGPWQVILYDLSRQQAQPLKLDISDGWVHRTLGQAMWSPDGRYLLLDYGTSPARGLILVEVASGQVVQEFGTEGGYAWSPESDAVVIGQRRPLDEPISVECGDAVSLAVLEVGAAEPQVLLEGSAEVLYFPRAWLPDGRILYNRVDWDEAAQSGDESLWTVTWEDGHVGEPQPADDLPLRYDCDTVREHIKETVNVPVTGFISWAPDNRYLVLQTGTHPNYGIYLLDWESDDPPRRLADGISPTWRPAPTVTAMLNLMPTPSPTPFVLTTLDPTDLDVARFIFDRHTPSLGTLTQQFRQELAAGEYSDFARQDVDVDGDGQTEILFSGSVSDLYLYVAILGRAGDTWQEWLYIDDYGHYCADVRAAVEADRVTADFITCTGGTGVFILNWEQRWIQCRDGDCAVVWSAPLLWTRRLAVTWTVAREYAVAEIEQPDAETIHLTTRRFGVTDLPPERTGAPPGTARRVVGPDTVETYRWDGSAYRLESRKQIAPGVVIAREFDLLTQETDDLVDDVLRQPFEQPGGSFDDQGLNAARASFWGLPSPDGPDDPAWGPWHRAPDAAAHNGDLEQVGEWVAGIVGANDRPLCRLTVQRRTTDGFDLTGRIELPCTANLTRLAWADVTGDGDDELLLLTIPPDAETRETAAGVQRLHIYAVDSGLTELATLDGALNGPDGAGVRLEDLNGDDTIEVLVGLPLVSLEHPIAWPDPTRRFQVYRWDADDGEFTPGEIRPPLSGGRK